MLAFDVGSSSIFDVGKKAQMLVRKLTFLMLEERFLS
jgi:hypothetical protein